MDQPPYFFKRLHLSFVQGSKMISSIRKLLLALSGLNPQPIDIFVGGRVKKIRLMGKIQQRQLAELLSIPEPHIELLEAGRKQLSAAQLFKLAQFFEVPVSAFFDRREVAA